MNDRSGRQYSTSRSGGGGPGGMNGPPRRRKYRKFYSSRNNASTGIPYRDGRSFSGDRDYSSPPPPPPPAGPPPPPQQNLDEIKTLFARLSCELDEVRSRVRELELSGSKVAQQSQSAVFKEGGDIDGEKERPKKHKMKKRERRPAKPVDRQAANNDQSDQPKTINTEQATSTISNNVADKRPERRPLPLRRDYKRPQVKTKAPQIHNDDSTTQAAEPSSEDRPEVDDEPIANGSKGRKVFRRRRMRNGKGPYNSRRRRMDSSERNSNDTSPQNEANGTDDHRDKRRGSRKRDYPELSESELEDVVQALQREFESSDKSHEAVKRAINNRGPKVAYEFAVTILDHAICNVTSPLALTKTAKKLQQLICSEDNFSEVDFQQAFYDALATISRRESEIAIDAPRYMDALGQLLGDCIIEMTRKHKSMIRRFMNHCIQAYNETNRALLLASIMRALQNARSERFAKEMWDLAHMSWSNYSMENNNLRGFLESQNVEFTTKTFPPELRKSRKGSEDLEKFADHITNLVEARCQPQELDDLVKDRNEDEQVEYRGTLIYAVIRGCLNQDSENYRLDNEALNKYSSILNGNEKQGEIALHALTALTRLWHQYNCPQDLMRIMILSLYQHRTASYEVLNDWLNSESLIHVPGMGAARLNTKRTIEDIGASIERERAGQA